MKLKHIFKIMAMEINRYFNNFIVTIGIMVFAFALIMMDASIYCETAYRIAQCKSVLSVQPEQLYLINLQYYLGYNEDILDGMYNLLDDLQNPEQGVAAGAYSYNELATKEEVLTISPDLLALSNIRDIEGNPIVLAEENTVAVGYELRERYPIGTYISNGSEGQKYKVVQILKKNSQWLCEDIVGGSMSAIDLDQHIVMDFNDYARYDYYNITNASCNMYVCHPTMSTDEINQYISTISDEYDLRLYPASSFAEIMSERRAYTYHTKCIELVFAIVCFLLSLIAMYMSIAVNMEYRKRLFGVLLSNKWTSKDIYILSVCEAFIRIFLSLILSIGIVYYICYGHLGMDYLSVFFWILPWIILVVCVFFFLCNLHIERKIRSGQIKNMLVKGK